MGMVARRVGLFLLAGTIGSLVASTTEAAACRFDMPADLGATPGRWLGACPDGTADGLGVIRAGTAEPYAFFVGRMQGGRPADGLLILREGGWMVAVRFDAGLHVVSSDGLKPEDDDRVFQQAHAAALETAARFRQEGNKASADYYTLLGRRITEGRPE